jgi:hypothetical protein
VDISNNGPWSSFGQVDVFRGPRCKNRAISSVDGGFPRSEQAPTVTFPVRSPEARLAEHGTSAGLERDALGSVASRPQTIDVLSLEVPPLALLGRSGKDARHAVRVRKPLRMKGAGQLRCRRLRRGRAASIGSSRLSPAPTATQVRGESTIVTARPVSSRSR